jgi:hypothetical protein
VRENVYLIESSDPQLALDVATRRARQEEGDANGTFTWHDRPAEWVFAGIRKLVAVTVLRGGEELTYSTMVLGSADELRRFSNGRAADVKDYE